MKTIIFISALFTCKLAVDQQIDCEISAAVGQVGGKSYRVTAWLSAGAA
jgi:hypothetical protein